jgi:hypothetical protein
MKTVRTLFSSVAFALAAIAIPAAANAQGGLTVWAGAGGTSSDGTLAFGKEAKQLGVQLSLPILPVAVRGDALLFGNDFDTDALSYNVNAVVQMRLPVIAPYGIIGRGTYAVAPGQKETGWNAGAGVRLGLGRFGVFGEVRRHDVIQRTVTVVGLTF